MSEKQKSTIVVEFVAPGSSEFGVHMVAVTPNQVFALAAYLQRLAGNMMDEQAIRARIEKPGLVIPQIKIN
jgi:hypothetical protein